MEYGVFFDIDSTQVLCNNSNLVYFKPPIVEDIYYGTSSSAIVTESYIKTNFLTADGFIGSPTGRYYIFQTGYSYKFWCIPDSPNDGNRVVKEIAYGSTTTVLAYNYYYVYYQTDPTPSPSITYGKININGVSYRIYRTITKASTNNEQYVYSFV